MAPIREPTQYATGPPMAPSTPASNGRRHIHRRLGRSVVPKFTQSMKNMIKNCARDPEEK